MPGMATPAEMARLRSLSGRALDVYFLQLMIRHHQGGVPMAREGADRASVGYVPNLATKIAAAQTAETATMEQMLRTRGRQPLPPHKRPSAHGQQRERRQVAWVVPALLALHLLLRTGVPAAVIGVDLRRPRFDLAWGAGLTARSACPGEAGYLFTRLSQMG